MNKQILKNRWLIWGIAIILFIGTGVWGYIEHSLVKMDITNINGTNLVVSTRTKAKEIEIKENGLPLEELPPAEEAPSIEELPKEEPPPEKSEPEPQCETNEMIFYYSNSCGWCQKVKNEGGLELLKGLGVNITHIDVTVGPINHSFRGVPTFVINDTIYSGYKTPEQLLIMLGCI